MRLPTLDSRRVKGARSPVYRQIADHIRNQIETGELRPGTRLPTIRALAADVGVNRDTVALAYESLSSAGLLDSVVGRGTFVRGLTLARGSFVWFAAYCALLGLIVLQFT